MLPECWLLNINQHTRITFAENSTGLVGFTKTNQFIFAKGKDGMDTERVKTADGHSNKADQEEFTNPEERYIKDKDLWDTNI